MRYYLSLLFVLIAFAGVCQPNGHFHYSTPQVSAFITDNYRLIAISKRTGHQILSLDFSLFESQNEMDSTSGTLPYYFADMNFDGYKDLVYCSLRYFSRFKIEVYLYNPKRDRLEYSTALSKIPCLAIYDKKQKIMSSSSLMDSSPFEYWFKKYQWINGKLILIEISGDIRSKKNPDYYYSYTKKRIKGKMVYTAYIRKKY